MKKQLTLEEYDGMVKKVRRECQTKFPVDDTLVDELASSRFPADRNLMVGLQMPSPRMELYLNFVFRIFWFSIKCHVNCALEDIGFIRKGNFNVALASKMIKIYAPLEFRDEWLGAFEACQNNKRMLSKISCANMFLINCCEKIVFNFRRRKWWHMRMGIWPG